MRRDLRSSGSEVRASQAVVAGEFFRTDQSEAWGAVVEINESQYRAAMNPRTSISMAESTMRLINLPENVQHWHYIVRHG
jgi:hypothetical protein